MPPRPSSSLLDLDSFVSTRLRSTASFSLVANQSNGQTRVNVFRKLTVFCDRRLRDGRRRMPYGYTLRNSND